MGVGPWSMLVCLTVSGAGLLVARPLLGAPQVKKATSQAELLQPTRKLERVPGTTMGGRFVELPQAGGPVVRDNETGRVWQRAPGASKYAFAAAKAACDSKVLGGYSDWRLPRIEELKGLMSGPLEAPLPEGHPFTVSGTYWSSTETSEAGALQILAFNGNMFHDMKTSQHAAWCVRGGGDTAYPNSNPRFQVVGPDVEDTQTGRVWKRQPTSFGGWHAVRLDCRGHGAGWRLPTIAELTGLVDMNAAETKLPPGHPFLNAWAPYDQRPTWSNDSSSISAAATLRFADGVVGGTDKATPEGMSRCIKMDLGAAWPLGPVGRFALRLGDAAVLDQETRLLWERAPTASGVQYPDAAAACAGKSIAGVGGWRLPTLVEITTLVDRDITSGAKLPAGHPFVGIVAGDYWTTTPHSSDMKTMDFGNGLPGHMSKMGGHLYGWCVRAEP